MDVGEYPGSTMDDGENPESTTDDRENPGKVSGKCWQAPGCSLHLAIVCVHGACASGLRLWVIGFAASPGVYKTEYLIPPRVQEGLDKLGGVSLCRKAYVRQNQGPVTARKE